jgi:hypothetical protein
MATTHDSAEMTAARREIFEGLDGLSLEQLHQILSMISTMERRNDANSQEVGGKSFVERMQALRDEFHVTDEEFEEFDRILREHDELEKRRLASASHE